MTIIDVCPYCDTPLEMESNTYIVIECPHCHKYFDIDMEDTSIIQPKEPLIWEQIAQ